MAPPPAKEPPSPSPPPRRWSLSGLLLLSILGISTAAPLIRLSHAPPSALAFWRMVLSALLTGALWAVSRGREPASFGPGPLGRKLLLMLLSGVFLGLHFVLWVTSLSFTTVAVSVVLVNTQPVFAALLAWIFLKEPPTGGQLLGILLALAGVALLALPSEGGEAGRTGALLALGGALSGSCYFVTGRRLRPETGLWAYVTIVYAVAALFLLPAALLLQARLWPFPPREWLLFAALAAGPTLFGHTLLNWALRWLPAPVVNVTALGEPVGASLLAFLIPSIGETPGPTVLAGGAITLLGIFFALGGSGREESRPPRSSPGLRRPRRGGS